MTGKKKKIKESSGLTGTNCVVCGDPIPIDQSAMWLGGNGEGFRACCPSCAPELKRRMNSGEFDWRRIVF